MHPDIVSFGPFAIRAYGLMLAIGFLFGIIIAAKRAERAGENPDHVYNLSLWIVASSLIGSRIYYILTHYYEFSTVGLPLFKRIIIEGKNMFWPVGADGQVGINGLVLYGGLIAATAVTTIYLKVHRLDVFKYMDLLAPSLGIGEFFTRIGCFLNGCCYGKPTDSIFGVVFPENSAAGYYYPHEHIHPSQLYNSLAGLAIFFLLLWLERFKKFNGFTALSYFILYAIGRFSLDFTRHYEEKLTVWGMSHNQILSLCILIACLSLLIYFWNKSVKTINRSL